VTLAPPDPILFGLAVRGEPVEPPATHPEPFDRLRANGGVTANSIATLPGHRTRMQNFFQGRQSVANMKQGKNERWGILFWGLNSDYNQSCC